MGQILLVRHGQASWDGDDYDVLSPTGHEQSRLLGKAMASRGLRPDVVVSGGMRRHRETVEELLAGAGAALDVVEDPGWDEYDHVSMLAHVPTSFEGELPTAAEFQAWIEQATARWTGGGHDADYVESFDRFSARVEDALRRTVEVARRRTAVVVTSGGPISWVATALLGGGAAMWGRLNVVCVNTGVTKLVAGRRGVTLVSFNEHTHLEGTVPPAASLLTYR